MEEFFFCLVAFRGKGKGPLILVQQPKYWSPEMVLGLELKWVVCWTFSDQVPAVLLLRVKIS